MKQNGYFQKFPPEGIEVVTWYIVMGIGQVVTLRVPVERQREVDRAVEETAWGGYRSEFYPTYDYKAIAQQQRESAKWPAPRWSPLATLCPHAATSVEPEPCDLELAACEADATSASWAQWR